MYSELLAWFNLRKGPQKKSKPTIITTELIVPFCNLYLHFVEDWLSLIAGALLIYLLDHHHAWGTGCLSTIFFFFRLRFTFKVVYIIPYFLFYILFLPFFFAWIKWGPWGVRCCYLRMGWSIRMQGMRWGGLFASYHIMECWEIYHRAEELLHKSRWNFSFFFLFYFFLRWLWGVCWAGSLFFDPFDFQISPLGLELRLGLDMLSG